MPPRSASPALVLLLLLTAQSAARAADKWTEFHYGPYVVVSSAGDKQARDALDRLEQFRSALSLALGKPDLVSQWPVTLVLAKHPAGLGARFRFSRDGYISEGLSQEAFADLARIFLDANTAPLPGWVEAPLIDLYSRLEIDGTHVSLGAPPPPAARTKEWARIHLLATDPRYSGRFRVFLYNLQQTNDADPAYRNAFERSEAQMDKELDAYFAAGKFPTTPVNAKAIHAERDFLGKPCDPARAALLEADLLLGATGADPARVRQAYVRLAPLQEAKDGTALATLEPADLKAAVETPSKNARVWFEYGRKLQDAGKARAAFQEAAKLNPKWSMPHYGLAQLETDPRRRAFYLAAAAKLEPRNTALWQALATAYTEGDQYSEASRAWTQAERATPDAAGREKIREARAALHERRLNQEAAERQRIAAEKERELNKLREESMARIREAEARANKGKAPLDPGQKPISYAEAYGGEKPRVTGVLERVDCLEDQQKRLHVRTPDKQGLQFLLRDPAKATITGKGRHLLACGAQKPEPKLTLEYRDKVDDALGTAGEVLRIEFQ